MLLTINILKVQSYLIAIVLFITIGCSSKKENTQLAEVACGQCQFGLTSQEGCDLAVRIDGNAYFVDGAKIDDFGDAHNEHKGFCEVIRKGNVAGEIVDNRFKVESIKLID